VKNLLGLVPGRGKKDAHVRAPDPGEFAELLADLAAAVRPGFAVLDAVVGMEGNGPNAGTPRKVGLLAASTDLVALDAVACRLIGYDPRRVPLIVAAGARGVGRADPDAIRVLGEPLEDRCVPDFRKPLGDRLRFLVRLFPRSVFGRLIESFGGVTSAVVAGRCRLCGECVRNCPAGAMSVEGGRVRVAEVRCIACYCCEEVCPYNAILMRGSHFARMVGALAGFFAGGRTYAAPE
jgi:ferredoxin